MAKSSTSSRTRPRTSTGAVSGSSGWRRCGQSASSLRALSQGAQADLEDRMRRAAKIQRMQDSLKGRYTEIKNEKELIMTASCVAFSPLHSLTLARP